MDASNDNREDEKLSDSLTEEDPKNEQTRRVKIVKVRSIENEKKEVLDLNDENEGKGDDDLQFSRKRAVSIDMSLSSHTGISTALEEYRRKRRSSKLRRDIMKFKRNRMSQTIDRKTLQWSGETPLADKKKQDFKRSNELSPSSSPDLPPKLMMSVVMDQFTVYLPSVDQRQQFFYNPSDKLSSIIEKVITAWSLDKDHYVATDDNGNLIPLDTILQDLENHYCSYIPKSEVGLTKVSQPEVIANNEPVFRPRSEQEISSILTSIDKTHKRNSRRTSTKRPKQNKIAQREVSTLSLASLSNISSGNIQFELLDEKCVLSAVSLPSLIQILCNCTRGDTVKEQERDFVMVFLIAYDSILTAREVWDAILEFLKINEGRTDTLASALEFISKLIQYRTDSLDEKLKKEIAEWLTKITSIPETLLPKQSLINQLQKEAPSKSIMEELRVLTVTENEMEDQIYLVSIEHIEREQMRDLFDFHPKAIARQMALYDLQLVRRIPYHEWHGQGWMKEKAPNISAVINRFNMISHWASTLIVLGTTTEFRAMIIIHLVHIAMESLQLNNYNAVLALVTGLSATPISRLSQTWAQVDSHTTRLLAQLRDLISISAKFRGLRDAQESAEGPCVPYLGVYLNDLTYIEDGNVKYASKNAFSANSLSELQGVLEEKPEEQGELINFERMQMVCNVISKVRRLAFGGNYGFKVIEVIQDYLNHGVYLGEDEIFEESLKREGKADSSDPKLKKKKNVLGFSLLDS
uniref:Ras-GEF domain-containing protein n=1 Tax=Arcella intermedia TaxID=1963864 RepID=A0A6B2KY03_9EUKA